MTRLSGSSLAMPRLIASPPWRLDQRGKPSRDRGDDLVLAKLGARRHHLVAGRRIATLGLRRTGSSAWFMAAASISSRGPSRVPAVSSTSPCLKSCPRGRICRPGAASFDRDHARGLVGILLDDDGVGASRHRRAGEDAHRLAASRRDPRSLRRQASARSASASRAARPRPRRAPHSHPWPRHRRAAG